MPEPLPLFYEEPNPDRWVPGDRYPRQLLRRLLRGARRPGGQEMVFLNLRAGLDRLGVPCRINDYRWARNNPDEPVGIIGKAHVLDHHAWRNPILFGAAVMSHPLADPSLLERRPIRRILVPGTWMQQMCAPHWGDRVRAWPVGIDTDRWAPSVRPKIYDVLLYDKVRWEHDRFQQSLINPILAVLERKGLRVARIRYGLYREEDFAALVQESRSMIFLCEHETQGLAYQQALASGLPILAWDRGGCWQDPEFYPDRVNFFPVTSVPYWDERCGATFAENRNFPATFDAFWTSVAAGRYHPRDYILEHLTLERCARLYLDHWADVFVECMHHRQ